MLPIITTGLNGLVGSKFAQMFADSYEFTNLDVRHPTSPVDITDAAAIDRIFGEDKSEFVIHLAAFTDVTAAWKQRGDKNGIAYKVNVIGTENIAKSCQKFNKHLIHISTAYVFDGKNDSLYTEEDQVSPIEWYGETKAIAEEVVANNSGKYTILRIDQPFRDDPFEKQDVAHRVLNGLKNNNLYPQFANHYFGPTYINDFAKILDWVIRTRTTGLYHASSGEKWSDFEFAKKIAEKHQLNSEVKAGDLTEYLKTQSRPYQVNTALNCNKLSALLDFKMSPIEEALSAVH